MNAQTNTDQQQTARWNGGVGEAWVEMQALLDSMFRPLETLLVEAAYTSAAGQVLDIGCGTGGVTLAVARRLGGRGDATGIDISEPMIAAARARAQHDGTAARFIHADAQSHAFEPQGFDLLISRFGVMFFDDPVRAFANLRRAARRGAHLRFIAWRSAAENPFMTAAERAAVPLLPNIPPRRPDGPGQFAFADRERVVRILEESGWTGADIQPIDVACTFSEAELIRYLTRLGPVGQALQEADEATRARVAAAVRPAFDPYVDGPEVRFIAACWMIGGEAA